MEPAPPSSLLDTAPTCAVHPSVRAEQACSRCGAFACFACVRTTAEGRPLCVTCDEREGSDHLPWDLREKLGTIAGFVKTCWAIIWHPARTLDRATPQGGMGSSLWFVVLAQITTWLSTGLIYAMGAAVIMGAYLFGADKNEKTLTPATTAGIAGAFIATMVVMVIVMGMGAALFLSALDHLVLRMIGARPRPYAVTLRAHALSMAPCIAGLVPGCGIYVVPVWAIVVRVFAYRGLHRISTGKAVAGALLVPGVLVALTMAGYLAILFLSLATARGTP
ncbi:MAG TPA: YIP1 family protein [Myxococcaceae bacterium]|nr:YIP1 family protein [Myxococcaceae bacterium]